MALDTLVVKSIINGGTGIVTEVTRKDVHVQMMEECAQNRDALDPILVRERKRIIDGTDYGLWVCLEVLVQLLR